MITTIEHNGMIGEIRYTEFSMPGTTYNPSDHERTPCTYPAYKLEGFVGEERIDKMEFKLPINKVEFNKAMTRLTDLVKKHIDRTISESQSKKETEDIFKKWGFK